MFYKIASQAQTACSSRRYGDASVGGISSSPSRNLRLTRIVVRRVTRETNPLYRRPLSIVANRPGQPIWRRHCGVASVAASAWLARRLAAGGGRLRFIARHFSSRRQCGGTSHWWRLIAVLAWPAPPLFCSGGVAYPVLSRPLGSTTLIGIFTGVTLMFWWCGNRPAQYHPAWLALGLSGHRCCGRLCLISGRGSTNR